MELDFVERRTLFWTFSIFFVLFLFLPFHLVIKIFFASAIFYFLVLFFLCIAWAGEAHPERKYIIGFLVSFFHTFVFVLGGVLAVALAKLLIFFGFLNFLKNIFEFFKISIWKSYFKF